MTMTEREACFSCGEPVALQARVCPYCDRSVLADVQIEAAVADQRRRYQLARSLAALGAPLPPFLEIQTTLAATRPVLVRGVTRADAQRILGVLEAEGVGAAVRASAAARLAGSAGRIAKGVVQALLLTAMIGGGWAWYQWMEPSPAGPKRGGAPVPAVSRPAALTNQDLASRSVPSTVLLRCAKTLGSGFFVTNELLLTNAHVLCPGDERPKVVFSDGRELSGEVVRSDERLDVALVRAAGAAARPLPIGDVATLSVGDKVVLVGNPYGLESTFHEGSISNLTRTLLGVAYVQVEAEIEPGNSGGPLLDLQGRVVGIISLKHTKAERIGFALPINYVYTGELPFLPAPARRNASDAFKAMVAKAEADDTKAARELSTIDLRPGLVTAHVDEYKRLVVGLARLSRTMPPYLEVSVKVWRRGEVVCTMKGDVQTWKVVESKGMDDANPRIRAWLERVGFDYYLYVGESPLRWDLCPREKMTPGIELELENAQPGAARLTLS